MSTRPQLIATVATDLPTNGVNLITAADVRGVLDDMIESTWVPETDGEPLVSPMTTAGDMIYGGVAGVATRLAAGLNTQLLVGGSTPTWTTATGTGAPVRAGSPAFTGTPTFADTGFTIGAVTPGSITGSEGTITVSSTGAANIILDPADTGDVRIPYRSTRDSNFRILGNAATSRTANINMGLDDTANVFLNLQTQNITGNGPRIVMQNSVPHRYILGFDTNALSTNSFVIRDNTSSYNAFEIDASDAVYVRAGGTNQAVTWSPSGTGAANISWNTASTVGFNVANAGAGQTQMSISNSSGSGEIIFTNGAFRFRSVTASRPITFELNTEKARFAATTGNLLLGGLTTDGTGVLQFPAATTNTGGIGMGTEIFFFRTGTNTAQISASAGLTLSGSIQTSAPNGGTAGAWKTGIFRTSTLVALDTANWVELDIGGTLHRLALITITTP